MSSSPSAASQQRPHQRRKRRLATAAPWWRTAWHALWTSEPAAATRWPWRWHVLLLGLYGVLALLLTYPLVRDPAGAVVGNDFDAWQNIWNFWWVRVALTHGQSPFFTPYLYAPDGAPLYLHTLNLFNGLLSLPFQVGGVVLAYNAVVLLSLVLSAFFAALLVTEVSGSRWAGFVGGVIFGFSAYQLDHFAVGQTNLLAAEWLPAYLLCLSRASNSVGRRRTLYTLAAVGALLLTTLCDWQYLVFGLLLTLLWWLRALVLRRWSVALLTLVVLLLTGVVLAPLLLATFQLAQHGIVAYVTEAQLAAQAADLVSFVVPNPQQHWWRWLTAATGWPTLQRYNRGTSLGLIPLGLAVFGTVLAWRRARWWLLLALAALLLALGPLLQVAGQRQFGPGGWTLWLPYHLLRAVPGLAITRVPARFSLLLSLAVAVLAGLALAALGRHWRPRMGLLGRCLLTALVTLFIVGEQAQIASPAVAATPPGFTHFLAGQGANTGTVLYLPFSFEEPHSLYWQTIHGQPQIAGYLSRRLNQPLLLLPPLAQLVNDRFTPDVLPPDPPDLAEQVLAYANVRWVVVDLKNAPRNREPWAGFLTDYADPTPLYDDGRFAVYARKTVPQASNTLALRIGSGWYAAEPMAGTPHQMRWLDQAGTISLWNLGTTTQPATLRLTAWSYQGPQRVMVRLDDQTLITTTITDLRELALPLIIAPGQHTLTLRALDQPVSPASLGRGNDPRLLTIGVTQISVQP